MTIDSIFNDDGTMVSGLSLYDVACWMRNEGFAFNTPIMVNGTFTSLREILFGHDNRVVKDFQGSYYGGYGFVVEG